MWVGGDSREAPVEKAVEKHRGLRVENAVSHRHQRLESKARSSFITIYLSIIHQTTSTFIISCRKDLGCSVPPLRVRLPQPVSLQPPVLLSQSTGMSWSVPQRAQCSEICRITEIRRYQLGQSPSSQTFPGFTHELLLHFPSVAAYTWGVSCCASLCPTPGFKNR